MQNSQFGGTILPSNVQIVRFMYWLVWVFLIESLEFFILPVVSEPPRDAGASGLSAPPVTLQHVEMHWQPTRGCGAAARPARCPAPPAEGGGAAWGSRGPRDQLSSKEEQRHLPGPARAPASSSGRSGRGPHISHGKKVYLILGKYSGGSLRHILCR